MISVDKFKEIEGWVNARKWALEFQNALSNADKLRVEARDPTSKEFRGMFLPNIWVEGPDKVKGIIELLHGEVARQLAEANAALRDLGIEP